MISSALKDKQDAYPTARTGVWMITLTCRNITPKFEQKGYLAYVCCSTDSYRCGL